MRAVGIDRIITHAGVAKASHNNVFGSWEELVRAYLGRRHASTSGQISRAVTRFRRLAERLLGVFDAQGEQLTDPAFDGFAFVLASAEAPPGGAVEHAAEEFRRPAVSARRGQAPTGARPLATTTSRLVNTHTRFHFAGRRAGWLAQRDGCSRFSFLLLSV